MNTSVFTISEERRLLTNKNVKEKKQMAEELKNLGRNMHMLLYERKMTKRELGKRVGVSQQMISQIVSGNRVPGTTNLIRIANALGVTVDDLLKQK